MISSSILLNYQEMPASMPEGVVYNTIEIREDYQMWQFVL